MRTPASITVSTDTHTGPAFVPYTYAVPIAGGGQFYTRTLQLPPESAIVITYRPGSVTNSELRDYYHTVKSAVRETHVILLPDFMDLRTCRRADLDRIIDQCMTARNELTQSTREVST